LDLKPHWRNIAELVCKQLGNLIPTTVPLQRIYAHFYTTNVYTAGPGKQEKHEMKNGVNIRGQNEVRWTEVGDF